MPIVFNALLKSTVANATFLDKTVDDSTIGIIELASVAVASGSTVTNAQREINISKKIIFAQTAKTAGDTISLNALSLNQEVRMVGAAAPVTLNILPFTNAQVVLDGCEIVLVGHDNTNTVTISYNDVDYGCLLNGGATLGKGYELRLTYDDEILRYRESGRNF